MKIFTKIAAFAVVALALVAGTSSADAAFTRYLTVGSTGTDVSELQAILVSNGYLASGLPTGYFGALTKAAVMKWQAAVGLPATGYFGPMSIAKIGMGSTSGSTTSTSGSTTGLKGGDGDFKQFDVLGSPNNKTLEEGETMGVFAFEFEADDSDLLIERTDLIVIATDGDVTKPWKVLESIDLTVGGKKIASVDASDEDNWDEQSTDDEYKIRLEDINYTVLEGKEAKVTVEVTVSDDIDTDEIGSWDVSIDTDGIRARNAKGIDVYEGDVDDTKEFTIEEATAGDLSISVDDDENDDSEVEVDEDDSTDDVTLYTAQVESEDGDNEIDEVTITLATTSGSVGGLDDMIDTLYLFIDGEEVGSESVTGSATDSVTFDDIDGVTIDEDSEVDFVVKADINEQGDSEDNYSDNDGVVVTGMVIDFIDGQDDDQTVTDTTDGGNITFSVNALSVQLVSATIDPIAPLNNDESIGKFFLQFKVSAPDSEDIYISKGATTSTTVSAGEGAEFVVVNGDGDTVTATTSNRILRLIGGGTETGGRYKITNGNTATFELEVTVSNVNHATNPRELGIALTGVNYKVGSNAVADTQYNSNLDYKFRSETASLNNSNTTQ